jgi:hypothetical protein
VVVAVTVVVGPVTVEVAVVVSVAVVVVVAVLVTVMVVVLTGRVVVDVTVLVVMVARVNVADAELRLASVAITVCAPAEPAGTLNAPEKAPLESLVTVGGVVVWVAPSYLIEMPLLGANPDPVTVTAVPGVPLFGLREIEMLTWNRACEIIAPLEMTWA